jgi:hypothetical protein
MAKRFAPGSQVTAEDLQALAKSAHYLIKAEIDRAREPWDEEQVEREAIQNEPPRARTIWERLRKPLV